MNPVQEPQSSLPIGWQVAATRLHEELLQAVTGEPVLQALLSLHAPHPAQTSDHRAQAVVELFGHLDGRPVCHGCDRAVLAPTRAPAWPCSTSVLIAQVHLGRNLQLDYPQMATDDPASRRERTFALQRASARSFAGPAWAAGQEGHR